MSREANRAPSSRLAAIAIVLASCAPYLGTLGAPLVWDDAELFAHQPLARTPSAIVAIVGSPFWGPTDYLYRPLTLWSLALDPGATPLSGRLVNLLLHAAVGCALFLFLRQLADAPWPSLAAALLFAVHPIHTEAVVQLVGRAELLAALCGLAFLGLHVRRRSIALAALCFLLALASKESAIAFLALALWTDACFPRGERRFRWPAYAAYGAVAIVWLVLRSAALAAARDGIPFLDNPLAHSPPLVRVLSACSIQLSYLRLLLAPIGLSADYSFDQIPAVVRVLDPRFLGSLAAVAVGVAVARAAWARQRVAAYGIGACAISFLPTANLLFPIGTVMGERLAYTPSLFAAVAVAWGAWLVRERRGRAVTVALGALIVALGISSAARTRAWADPTVFARTLVRSAPASAKAHFTLAIEEQRAGSFDDALASLGRAVAIHPRYAEAWSRIGSVSTERGDPAAAREAYLRAIEIYPGFAEAQYGLGFACQELGRFEEAATAYRTAIDLDPALVPAHANLGVVLARLGRFDEAERQWLRVLELAPDHAAARENLAQLQALRRR